MILGQSTRHFVVDKVVAFIARHYNAFRNCFLLASDFLITFLSLFLSIFLYVQIAERYFAWTTILQIAFCYFAVRSLLFLFFKINQISFQYASPLYILKISLVISFNSATNYFLLMFLFPGHWSWTLTTLDWFLNLFASVAFRYLPLLYWEIGNRMKDSYKNCLIYGCGQTGMSLIQGLEEKNIRVKGFIDDQDGLRNKVRLGIKVLGTIGDLGKIVIEDKIDLLVVAIPSLSGEKIKDVKSLCSKFNIEVRVVPAFYQIVNRNFEMGNLPIRDINYEDLLRRKVQKEDYSSLKEFFCGKTVMVTGAGSIGSELVRQIVCADCERVVVLDNAEYNLFTVYNSIKSDLRGRILCKLIDLKNKTLLADLFYTYEPRLVFHTASYKHVSFLEENMCEGVANNLSCLQNVYDLSTSHCVDKFIFISSDKAVNPMGIMGVTKLLGELYLQARNSSEAMIASSVRFGNVIGSSGSLIPKIIKQIQNNEEITLTHPKAKRFFMLVSEAVLLILKAAAMAQRGKTYILDMKEPVYITDIVSEVAHFYGKSLNGGAGVRYIGLQPGEKLVEELRNTYEEIVLQDGLYVATMNKKIGSMHLKDLLSDYEALLQLAFKGKKEEMMELISKYTTREIEFQNFSEAHDTKNNSIFTS